MLSHQNPTCDTKITSWSYKTPMIINSRFTSGHVCELVWVVITVAYLLVKKLAHRMSEDDLAYHSCV